MHQLNKKIIVLLGLSAVIILLLSITGSIKDRVSDFYYFTLKPEAGTVILERRYKDNFDKAQATRDGINFAVVEMKQNIKTTDDLLNYQGKIRKSLTERELYLLITLEIDKEALRLRLPEQYKEFYQKRKTADENELEAFRIYRDGSQRIMSGMLVYHKFFTLYNQTANLLLKFETEFTPENAKEFDRLSSALDLEYQEVASLREQKIFTDDLGKFMEQKNEEMKLFNDLNKAVLAGDKKTGDKLATEISAVRARATPNPDELLSRWTEEKSLPIYKEQDEKHKKSWDLYHLAYQFARDQKLTNLLTVWENTPPGIIPAENLVK